MLSAVNEHRVDPYYRIEMIDPARAAQLLARNSANRALSPAVARRYADDMAAGRWQYDGSPIRIAITGELIDGQHRCNGIILSQQTIPMLVIYDLPMEVRDSIDTGRVRTARDVLQMAGVGNSPAVAATARVVMSRLADAPLANFRPSNIEIRQWVEANGPAIGVAADVYAHAKASRQNRTAYPSIIAAAYYLCAQVDPAAADSFYVTRLIEGVGVSHDDPVRLLQARLAVIRGKDSYAVRSEQLRYILLAWNIWRSGRVILKLQAPKGGWTSSNFPIPR